MIISLLLLFVMVLSVSASFAASDDAGDLIAVDDTADDDVVATDDSNQDTLKEAPIVTKDNFNDYFDESGTYSSDEEELVFEGDFSGLDISAITIAGESTVKFTGKNATFKNVQVMIMQDDVTIDGFNFVTDENNQHTRLIHIIGVDEYVSNIVLSNNNITFIGPKDSEAYAIFAGGDTVSGSCEVSGLQIINNNITYVGNSDGTQINNVIRVNGDTEEDYSSDKILVQGNNFDIQIPSIKIKYGTFGDAQPFSEAIVFYYCDDVKFIDNKVKIKASDKIGSQDTINVVSAYGDSLMMMTSSNIIISGNEIEGVGGSAIYGIKVSAEDFEVTNNKINLSSDEYYANGISIEGPSSNGLVDKNNITLTAPVDKYTSVYGIYTWQMMGANKNITYSNNIIDTTGYLACGMEINQPDPVIGTNTITSKGNFTYGIAASIRPASSEGFITNNVINCLGNNVGMGSGDSILKTASAGISTLGKATISGNKINSTSVGIISVDKGEVAIFDNEINVTATGDNDNYAIKIDGVEKLEISNNNVTFVGSTDGSSVFTNALRVSEVSGDVLIFENNFDIQIPSVDVPWFEVPEGSGNWISTPISEGIVIEDSDDVTFDGNIVKLEFKGFSTSYGYDTIYVVDFTNSNNAIITNNKIKGKGKDYIYGLILSGDNFTIRANNITSSSEFYANGIDIEGPASGVVEDNVITVNSNVSAYGIYSGMNGQDVVANYTGNNISGNAYNVFGFSLGDAKSELVKNEIMLDGNYTTGIAYRGGEAYIKENLIVLMSSEEGNESVWENFGVEAVGVKVLKGNVTVFNNTIATQGKGLHIAGNQSNVVVEDNFINVVGNDDKNAFAVYVNGAGEVDVVGNTVDYQGTTQGTAINNAVFIYESDDVIIAQNKFNLDLVSCYVPWFEIPEGTGNWISVPISEGIVVEDSNNMIFDSNNVTVQYTDVVGGYDTIYSVAFKNSNNSVITNNNITSKGNTYIYGLQVSGDDFIIRANTINTTSNYYANGIDIEGPASGVVEDNTIIAKASNLSYPVYSGMNGKPVSVNITGNDIQGEAYLAIAAELAGQEAIVKDNTIVAKGNHTMGIASKVDKLTVANNQIISNASNEGNETISETFGTNTTGIKIAGGQATISNNNVKTTGDYAIDVADTNSTIQPNHVESAKGSGVNAVHSTGNATIDVKIKTSITAPASVTVLLTKVKSGYTIKVVLKDSDGKVLAKSPITVNGKAFTTDANGAVNYKVSASKVGTQSLNINYAGTDAYAASTAKVTVKITKEKTKLTAKKKTFKAKKKVKKYTVVLKDSKKKAIKKVKVTLKVKGKTYKAKTNSKGKATFKIKNLKKKGTYKAKVKFAGNKYYKASSKSVKIKVKK